MARDIYHFDRPRATRLSISLILLFAVFVSGTFGYSFLEGWSLADCFYMTVITVSTVGFKEVHALSPDGQLFTIFIVFFGVTTATLSVSALFEYSIMRGMSSLLGRKKMDKYISKLHRHVIICGWGRTGSAVARDLRTERTPFVVIENDPAAISRLEQAGIPFLEGDAAEEEMLERAGIMKADSLVACLGKDADNLFLTLGARSLNAKMYIIARVEDPVNGKKFVKAGASQVVSPISAGANRIVQHLIRPTSVDLIELVSANENLELEVREIEVDAKSELANKTLAEARVRQTLGCMVFGIRRIGSTTLFDPDPETKLLVGDVLIAIQKPQEAV